MPPVFFCRLWQTLLASMASLSLAACTVGPDYERPTVDLATRWQDSQQSDGTGADGDQVDEEALIQWWRRLNDPILDHLIDAAVAGSPDLATARARLKQARALRRAAAAESFPIGSVSSSGSRESAGDGRDTQIHYETGVGGTWTPDLFGGTRRAIEAAEADVDASLADMGAARIALVASVAQTYVDMRTAQWRLAIARDNLESQTETLRITDWREQAGLATAADVEQARTVRERTRAAIPDLQQTITESRNRLAVLTGRPPERPLVDLVADDTGREGFLPEVPASMASGIPADLLRRRPDLRAAERTLAAETARIGERTADRFPSLTLSGTLGWQGARFIAGTLVDTIAGTVSATLFDGGRVESSIEAQAAVRDEALEIYRQTLLTALEEVENALAAHATSRERLDARRTAAEAARRADILAKQNYEAGLADFQTVLDTQSALLTTQDELALAASSQLSNLIALYAALGGGWDPDAVAEPLVPEAS